MGINYFYITRSYSALLKIFGVWKHDRDRLVVNNKSILFMV